MFLIIILVVNPLYCTVSSFDPFHSDSHLYNYVLNLMLSRTAEHISDIDWFLDGGGDQEGE